MRAITLEFTNEEYARIVEVCAVINRVEGTEIPVAEILKNDIMENLIVDVERLKDEE